MGSVSAAEIGLVLYRGAQISAVQGLTDLFHVAGRFARMRTASSSVPVKVSHWQVQPPSRELVRVFDSDPTEPGRARAIIVPPSLSEQPPSREIASPFLDWMLEQHAKGAILASICAGTFLLAETGALAGRAATTHWTYAPALKTRFGDIRVNPDRLVIDDGDIITAGGVMAWTDLGLTLVERLLGPTVMDETARFLVIDPPGRQQSYYSSFTPRLDHGDEAILRLQHWLRGQEAHQVSVAMMSRQSNLEQRTLLRRFRRATGMNPVEYCQNLRVGAAREKLQFTNRTISEIAWAVGYQDPAAFRRIFHRVTGLSPSQYRQRFRIPVG